MIYKQEHLYYLYIRSPMHVLEHNLYIEAATDALQI